MKKYILLIMILIITGCSSEYNLNIEKDTIFESASMTFPKSVTSVDSYNNQTQLMKNVYGDNLYFYNINKKEDENNYYLNYSFTHNINQYKDSTILKMCYSDNGIKIDDKEFLINTSDTFNCIYMDDGAYMNDVTVNIKTKLKVLDNNADIVNGDTYTWKYNEDNYDNKPIYIKIDRSVNKLKVPDNVSSFGIFISIGLILGLFVYIFYRFIKKKSIEKNEF